MIKYALPDLPYDYGALEPHISAKIMQLHHDKHHKTYVDGANQTLEALAEARDRGDFARIAALEHQLAFHVSGHVLHSIFWKNMSPNGGGKPTGELASAPVGSPPPLGDMFFQNMLCSTWPETWNASWCSSAAIRAKSLLSRASASASRVWFAPSTYVLWCLSWWSCMIFADICGSRAP